MITAIFILAAASLIASGVLFKHQRLTTLLATTGVLWEGHWLLTTLLQRTLFPFINASTFYTIFAVIVLLVWGLWYKKWSFPWRPTKLSLLKEGVVAIVIAVTLAAAFLVAQFNGWYNGSWVMHGFYNGDTATLIALTQGSFNTNTLLKTNLFAAGTSLEYPTLLHGGLATFMQGLDLSSGWLQTLPYLTYFQIIITIPLFFLLWDLVTPAPSEEWKLWYGVRPRNLMYIVQGGIVLLVMMLAWDNFVYPQSHFFLTALFILEAALFISARKLSGFAQLPAVKTALAITIVLMFANAVTGAAATAIAAAFCIVRANDRQRPLYERGLFAIAIPILAAIFLAATPGEGSFGWPQFSYTAALDMLRLAPYILVLAAASLWQLTQHRFTSTAVAACVTLAFISFFFSTRDIVVANASRFFYHSLLIGFPLLIYPLIRTTAWIRRELLHTTHTFTELATGWVFAVTTVLLLILPALASVASAHDNLMFKDEQVISRSTQEGMDWLAKNTDLSSVILSSPDAPWIVPLLAGRSMLRADYWLSPDDLILNDVRAAFAGHLAAQENVTTLADYLVVRNHESPYWPNALSEPAFSNEAVTIYSLR